MPLDPYSLCPGGRDKKIRFCCPDLIKEIEQIERLLESNQAGACLTYIESLEKDHPDCACLTAAKLSVYRTENRWKEAQELAGRFFEKEPGNPVAASEYALASAVNGNLKQSVSVVVDAFQRAKEGTVHSSLLSAALQVGACLLVQGFVLPAVAIGTRLKTFPSAQEPANALLYRALSLIEIPLLLRDMMFDQVAPDDFPDAETFDDAIELLGLMRWKEGLAKLESLKDHAGVWPNIWRDIAAVRFWLLENEAGKEALAAFAASPKTPSEDAADAEATRLFMTDDALGDQTEILEVVYPISDAEAAREQLLSKSLFYAVDVNPRAFDDPDSPPPKAVFVLLDRPFAEPDAELTVDNVSSQLATCLLYGKETDRDARLTVLDLLADERPRVESILKETLGETVRDAAEVDSGRTMSRTQSKIQYRFRYTPRTIPSGETMRKLEREYYETVFADFWCHAPLGLLDGKTPAEAAPDPAFRIRILAAILMLEYWMNEETGIDVANMLRRRLNLPELGPIPVPDGSEEELLGVLDEHPAWRWYRFDTQKLPTAVLAEGLQVVAVMKEPRATSRFAKELLSRPMKDMPIPVRILAFESLIGIARGLSDLEEALAWVDQAKNEAAELGIADAGWYLHEIPIQLGLGRLDKVHDATEYVVRKYGGDEQVMQALHSLFVQLGFMNPDGTPSSLMNRAMASSEPPGAAAPASMESEGGRLWTPNGAAPSENVAPSKLWTPD